MKKILFPFYNKDSIGINYYAQTTNYTAYTSIIDCITSGERLLLR